MPASDVRKLVLSALGGQFSPASPAVVQFFDGMYYLPTLAEVRWIFARSVVAKMEWTVERFDCDDFAFGLKGEFSLYAYRNNDLDFGLSLGVVAGAFTWQPAHVACFFVDATETVYLLEPRAADPVNPHGVIAFLDPSACQSCNLILL